MHLGRLIFQSDKRQPKAIKSNPFNYPHTNIPTVSCVLRMKSFSKLRCNTKLLHSSESVPLNKLQAFSGNDTNCALKDLSPATAIMNGSSDDLRMGPVENCY